MDGHEIPIAVTLQESAKPTIVLPSKATIKPINTRRGIRSRRIGAENIATHKGVVVTNTTELATLVYCREVIQVAKCNASNAPESSANA